MHTRRVARAIRWVALHTLRVHWLRHTFQMWSHHIWLKRYVDENGVCVCVCFFAHVMNLHISLSSLMSHPSLSAPSLLFPHGQRDGSAVPPAPKLAGLAHSDVGDEEFGYLAKSSKCLFCLSSRDHLSCRGLFQLLQSLGDMRCLLRIHGAWQPRRETPMSHRPPRCMNMFLCDSSL